MANIQKKHLGILVAIVTIASVGAVSIGSSYANNIDFAMTSPKITQGEAVEIAIKHLGTDISYLDEIDVDKEGESFLYSVDFIIGDEDISVEIDPYSGEILVVEREPVGSPDTDDGEEDDESDND